MWLYRFLRHKMDKKRDKRETYLAAKERESQEDKWTDMREEIEHIFRSDFKRGKITPERKLKMDRQTRQSTMESGERLNG